MLRPLFLLTRAVACCASLLAGYGAASSGDRHSLYQTCIQQCPANQCLSFPPSPRLATRLCLDDCSYDCMRTHATLQLPVIHKYYGKWHFTRILGAQEPASVLASAANLLAHTLCFARLRRHAKHLSTSLPPWVVAIFAAQCTLWIASIVFHFYDTPLTELADYLCASLLVLVTLGGALSCALSPRLRFAPCLVAMLAIWVFHVHGILVILPTGHAYLYPQSSSWVSFEWRLDFGLNMLRCASAGAVSAALNIAAAAHTLHVLPKINTLRRNSKDYHRANAARMSLYFHSLLPCAMMLEIFDFPPLFGALDAHAMWHIATVPLTLIFYQQHRYEVSAAAAAKVAQKVQNVTPRIRVPRGNKRVEH